MTIHRGTLLLASLVGTLGLMMGCGAAETKAPSSPASEQSVPKEMPPCAFEVPGTTSSDEDIEDGIAIDFVTSGDVQELRRRVVGRTAYAKAHPQPSPVAMEKETAEIPGGIRMIVHAVDPSKAGEVRAMVRKQIAKLKADADEKPM